MIGLGPEQVKAAGDTSPDCDRQARARRCRRTGAPSQRANVRHPPRDHLYWPDLDVDLPIESIRHPERFPLRSRVNE
jgi:hypothetical protein